MKHEELLQELGKILNMDLSFDEEGNCLFLVEDKYSLCIRSDEENDRIILLGNVADELPEPVDYSLVTDLLDFGMAPILAGGPAIGRDPETGILTAWAFVMTKKITADDFIQAVKRFMEFQVVISDRIAGNDTDEESEPGDLQFINA